MGYDVENTAGNARRRRPDREQSQPALSYEQNEIFTKDLEVRRNLGNRASLSPGIIGKGPITTLQCLFS